MPAASCHRPNLLLIQADDFRFDGLGDLGRLPVQTPNLDRLMARGTTFSRAHIMGSSSGAVCMPSRAMLHSGRTLYQIEGQGYEIPESHTTLGEHLRSHGYHTWFSGKWHSDKASFHRSFAGGDEIFFGGMTDHWNMPAYRYDPSGAYGASLPACPDPMHGKAVEARPCDHIHAGRHSSEVIADAAIRFLASEEAAGAPWMMTLAPLAPHDPRVSPERFRDRIDAAGIDLPPNFLPVHPFDHGALAIRDEKLAGFPRTEREVREHIADYCAIISHLDHELGRVLEALEASGAAEETIVVMTADHGLAVGQHGLMGKQNLYDHSVRIPMILAGPGIPAGQTCSTLCYHIDLYPTLCELLGLPVPGTAEGRSLAPALADPSAPVRDVVHLAYCHTLRGASDGHHKLIETVVDGRLRVQLFDLERDPWETENLAADPAYAQTLDALTARIREWRDQLHDDRPGQGGDFWAARDTAVSPSAASGMRS